MADATVRVGAMLSRLLEPGESVVAGAYATMGGAMAPVYTLVSAAILAACAAIFGLSALLVPAACCVLVTLLMVPPLRHQRSTASKALGLRLRAGMALAVTDHGRLIVCRARPSGELLSDMPVDSLNGVAVERIGRTPFDRRGRLTLVARDGTAVRMIVGQFHDGQHIAESVRLALSGGPSEDREGGT